MTGYIVADVTKKLFELSDDENDLDDIFSNNAESDDDEI